MTRQYKNPFEDPDAEFWDKKVKDYKIPKRRETPLEGRVARIPGYIYVPKINLYVAKEKSLHGKNWYETHEELHKKGFQMLTIRQFIDFILYLKQNQDAPDAKKILDEILGKRGPYRQELLDAGFSEKTRGGIPIKDVNGDFGWDDKPGKRKQARELYMFYNHETVKDKLVAKKKEPLEKCLIGNYLGIDLSSCNKQGLPTKKGNDISYHSPVGGCVALFEADSDEGSLTCNLNYLESHPALGVRAARKK